MKAKNLYYVMALCAGSFAFSNVANAQDVFVDDAVSVTEFTCDNSNHYFSNWRNNWFIEISAGGNKPIVERGQVSNTMDAVAAGYPPISASVSKAFTVPSTGIAPCLLSPISAGHTPSMQISSSK